MSNREQLLKHLSRLAQPVAEKAVREHYLYEMNLAVSRFIEEEHSDPELAQALRQTFKKLSDG